MVAALFRIRISSRELGNFTLPEIHQLRRELDRVLIGILDEPTEQILEATLRYFKITRNQIFSRRRTELNVWPRQVCMFLLRERTELSLNAVGGVFGKDHGTVLHAIAAVRRRMLFSQFAKQVESIRDSLNSTNNGDATKETE